MLACERLPRTDPEADPPRGFYSVPSASPHLFILPSPLRRPLPTLAERVGTPFALMSRRISLPPTQLISLFRGYLQGTPFRQIISADALRNPGTALGPWASGSNRSQRSAKQIEGPEEPGQFMVCPVQIDRTSLHAGGSHWRPLSGTDRAPRISCACAVMFVSLLACL